MFFVLLESGWFWLGLWLIGGTICVAFDSDWILLALSIGILAGLKWLAGKGDLFTIQNLMTLLPWFLVYIPCGILWSFIKWFWLISDYKATVIEGKIEYKDSKTLPSVKNITWDQYKQRYWPQPTANKNKSKICRWIAYWPLSFINSICYDFVKRFFNMIYDCLGNTYERITKWALRGIE